MSCVAPISLCLWRGRNSGKCFSVTESIQLKFTAVSPPPALLNWRPSTAFSAVNKDNSKLREGPNVPKIALRIPQSQRPSKIFLEISHVQWLSCSKTLISPLFSSLYFISIGQSSSLLSFFIIVLNFFQPNFVWEAGWGYVADLDVESLSLAQGQSGGPWTLASWLSSWLGNNAQTSLSFLKCLYLLKGEFILSPYFGEHKTEQKSPWQKINSVVIPKGSCPL